MKLTSILLIAVLMLTACGNNETTTETNAPAKGAGTVVEITEKQAADNGIRAELPKLMAIGATVNVTGTVEVPPQNKTAISFPFGGFVSSVPVLDGMSVKKGQVLLTVEDPQLIQLQQDYLEVWSQLEYLKEEYERQRKLGDQGVNSGKTVQLAQSNYRSAQAKSEGLRLKLEMAGISPASVRAGKLIRKVPVTSPFSGVVTKLNAAIGHYVRPEEVLLEIIDLKHCHVELFVFEKDIPALNIGQRVEMHFPNREEPVQAKVYLIGKEISADRMVKVHCHLEQEDPTIIPGTFVAAEVDLTGSKQLSVPSESIVKLKGKDIVFIEREISAKKKRYEAVPVDVIGEEKGYSAIRFRTAVPENSKVVISGAYTLVSTFLLETQLNE